MDILDSRNDRTALRLAMGTALLILVPLIIISPSERTQIAHGAVQATLPPPYYYYVTTGEDEPPDIPNSNCGNSTGSCTLRAAVTAASQDLSNISRIFLPPGTYTLTYGSLVPEQEMEILGDGAGDTIISAPSGGFSILSISNHSKLSLYDVTLSHSHSIYGGAINNQGELTLIRSIVSENEATIGGGIWNEGTLTLMDSLVGNNRAAEGVGGIINMGVATLIRTAVTGNVYGGISNGGTLTVYESTIASNRGGYGAGLRNSGELILDSSTIALNEATAKGGGLYSDSGHVIVINSTLSGNSADSGGGIYNAESSTIWISSATVAYNNATNEGGGIFVEAGAGFSLRNTILSANAGGNCQGSLGTVAHTLVSSNDCYLTGSVIVADPLLGDLQDNGGPTATHALLEDSPARNAVPAADCTDFSGQPLLTDQRGMPRLQGQNCDIGAFELIYTQFLPLIGR